MSWFNRITGPNKSSGRAPSLADGGLAKGLDGGREAAAKKLNLAASFPSFQSTAGDQLNTRSRDALSSVRMKLRNAYTPSQPIRDWNHFAGRTEILTSLIRAIEDGRLHTVIYGERGIGKTSILHVLAQSARRARYLVSYVSCGATSTFDEMFRAVAEDIPLLYHSAFGPTSPEAEKGTALSALLPDGEVTVRQASDLCAKLTGTRVLIVLDEFDRCESEEFRLNVAEFLKSLSDRSVRVQLIIAGVAHNLTELVEHIPSIQRNVFALEIPPLSGAEARQLVKTGESASGMSFEAEAVEMIVPVSNGLPYLASLIAHHAGLNALDAGRTEVTRQDVRDALNSAVTELQGRVSKRSQEQVNNCVQDGAHKFLGPLAGFAQLSGGHFDQRSLEMVAGDRERAVRTKDLVDRLVQQGVLLEAQDHDGVRSYRFIEESVPVFLWLLSAKENLREREPIAIRPEKGKEDKARPSAATA